MDQLDALRAILSGTAAKELESETLEFKQEDESLKRTLEIIADAVVCLANADGGHVIVGVSDVDTGPAAIRGVSSALTVEAVVRGIFDRTSPPLSVPVSTLSVNDTELLEVTVPRGATHYSNAKGTATRRVGSECRPFTPEQQRQSLAARGLHDWSAASSSASLDVVDQEELGRVRRLLVAAGRSEIAARDAVTLLRDLRLLRPSGELTWAGLLLVGTPDALADLAPHYGYSYQYRPSPGAESAARFRGHRPLLAAIEQILAAAEARRSVHALNVAGGVQLQLYDYPLPAVRELVVNGFIHRDFENPGSVDIDHAPERMTVSSPGGLVFGVTPDNILTHPSTPRNRLLLDVVTTLQVAERMGQGVDRAYREMLRVGKPPPTYADRDTRVEASLTGGAGNDTFVRYLATELPEDLASDIDVLLIIDLLRARRSVDAASASPRIQRPAAEAQRVLTRLSETGIVEASKRTARQHFPKYALTPDALAMLGRAVAYHHPTAATRDQKIIDHVAEYGHITNQSLRRLFDITVYQARDLLRDLQNRKILVKLDDRTGGRGIRYGPGANWLGSANSDGDNT